jgi:hypothetical protein
MEAHTEDACSRPKTIVVHSYWEPLCNGTEHSWLKKYTPAINNMVYTVYRETEQTCNSASSERSIVTD